MTDQTGWKVTENGKSVIATSFGGGLKYPRRKWVNPHENWGPLAVFDTREAAQKWMNRISYRVERYKVRRCVFKPSPYPAMWRPNSNTILKKSWLRLEDAPPGTRFAAAVKCLE